MNTAANEQEPVSSFCPRFHHAVELIGRRWTGAIVRVLLSGSRRFNEIHDAIPGLSDRLLTERLRELEREKIVTRVIDDGPPLHAVYTLTQSGKELDAALREIGAWAERWIGYDPPASASDCVASSDGTG